VVDKRNETVILPIYGMAVPFHISTLKTASKSDEGEFVMLRFNFVTPGQAGNKKEDLVNQERMNDPMMALIPPFL
jgi:nucleosome binding factor SPN SPT16 subunit